MHPAGLRGIGLGGEIRVLTILTTRLTLMATSAVLDSLPRLSVCALIWTLFLVLDTVLCSSLTAKLGGDGAACQDERGGKGGDMGVSLRPPLATLDPDQLPQPPYKVPF